MPKKKLGATGNIYRQKDREGIMIRWVDAQGRRRGKLCKVATVKEARAQLAKKEADVTSTHIYGTPPPSDETFESYAKVFLAAQENRISAKVMKGHISRAEFIRQKGIVEKYLVPFFGTMKLAQVRKSDIKRFIDKRTGQVSSGTVIKETNTLKRLFTEALDDEKVPFNPAWKAKMPQAPKEKTIYLTPEQWMAVFKACEIPPTESDSQPTQWLQQVAGLSVALGTRRGELLAVRVPDVDLDAKQVVLRQTKNGEERVAYINALAMKVFESMELRRRKQRGDRGVLWPGVTPEQVSMRFIRAARASGAPEGTSLHSLRHTYATQLKLAGRDLDDIRRLLGHGDLRMTQRYAKITDPHLAKAADALDGILTLPAPTA